MTRRSLPGGTLEYAVLAALWKLEPATARELHTHVGRPSGLVYTTIAKVLDRLYAKRLVRRSRAGRSFVYRAAAERHAVDRGRMGVALRELFEVSPAPAVASLVAAMADIDPKLVDELESVIQSRRRARRGP